MKKNKKYFLFIIVITFFIILFSNISLSHDNNTYKTISVSRGDTLWSIAKEIKNNNTSYSDKNIQEIIYEIKRINNISDSNLKVGQELSIPN